MLTIEQKKLRKNGLGGSDIAAILGLSSYKTAVEIYFEKTEEMEDKIQTDAMKIGSYLESSVLKMYEDETHSKVINSDIIYHKKHKFLFGNLDGIIEGKNIIVEAKTTSKSKEWGEPGSNEIPAEYLLQVAHYANIQDCEKVDIAVLFMDIRKFEIYTYTRNESLEKIIETKAIEFWENHIIKKIPPCPANADDCNLIFKEVLPNSLVCPEEISQQLIEYKKLQTEIKCLEEKQQNFKDKIAIFFNNHEFLVDSYNNLLATYRSRKGRICFDHKKLSEDYPDIYNKYAFMGNSFRVLSIK